MLTQKSTGLHTKYPLFVWYFNETLIFPTDFLKVPSIKFHENPSSVSRVVPCGRMQRQMEELT